MSTKSRQVRKVPLTDIGCPLIQRSCMRVKEHRFRRASSDWIKLTTVSRSPHVSFFFRSVGCNRREVLLTYLHQLNISGPRWPGLVSECCIAGSNRRRHVTSANESRESVHAHDRAPLCRFGIWRRPSGWHDGGRRWLTDDAIADPAVRHPPCDGGWHRSPLRRCHQDWWQRGAWLGEEHPLAGGAPAGQRQHSGKHPDAGCA